MLIDRSRRLAAAAALRVFGTVRRNRERLYMNAQGVRMLCFHATPDRSMDTFRRVIEWCVEHYAVIPPAAMAHPGGPAIPADRDALLITFDDGIASNHTAARWLADQGLSAVFFVVPSFIDRTMDEFLQYHADRGVTAFRFDPDPESRGLARAQIDDMIAMGHLIAGHNFAHRDLGQLSRPEDLDYEIGQAIDTIAEWTGRPCDDYAWGFGHYHHLSPEAAAYLSTRCARVYSAVRGLNVPGLTPGFMLRDCVALDHPFAFVTATIDGALDRHWKRREWAGLERRGGLLRAE